MTSAQPLIVTERLALWQPTFADLRPLYEIVRHPETLRFLGSAGVWLDHYSRFHRNAGGWFLHGYGNFLVRMRGEDAIIGTMGVFHSNRGLGSDFDQLPEAGWILAHDQVGKGYASEGMTAAIEWFECEHGAQRIVCMLSPDNAPSVRVAEKLGFKAMRAAAFGEPDEPVVLMERLAREP